MEDCDLNEKLVVIMEVTMVAMAMACGKLWPAVCRVASVGPNKPGQPGAVWAVGAA